MIRGEVVVKAAKLVTRSALAVLALLPVSLTGNDLSSEPDSPNGRLSLPVISVVDRYPPYADFCRRHPRECELTGAASIPSHPDMMQALESTNVAVNAEIGFMSDISQYNAEDHWALPVSGYGDCEDLALEKRSRLTASGIPRAALRLAFVSHRRLLNAHCVLTVETTEGTYVLDSYSNEVSRWDRIPYNFEARERIDGFWDRFDQDYWRYDL